jgi:hypothetical protein
VALNVPLDATGIFFGVLLTGPGTVWLNSVNVEEVGSDVPTTGADPLPRPPKAGTKKRPDEPTNLDFAEK